MKNLITFILWDFDPTIIELSVFNHAWPIRWYGLLFAAGLLASQQVLYHIFAREGKPRQSVDNIAVYVVVATIIGARLGHYLFYEWQLLLEQPFQWLIDLITPPFAGLASHGATVGVLFGLYLYSRKYQDQTFLWVVDRIVIVASISGAMIRLGNLLNSEIYGTPTSVPWAFLFVRDTDPAMLPAVPRHPTQLYETLVCIFLLVLTFYLWKTRRSTLPDGVITGIFMVILFTSRFLIEFLKNNQKDFEQTIQLNMGQILSIPVIIAGAAILARAYRRRPNRTPNT